MCSGFYINLPVGGVVAIMLLFIQIPDSDKTRDESILATIWHKLDLVGFCIFAPAIIQLLLALEWGGNEYAWNSATIIGLFCGAGGTMLVFLGWEYHKGDKAMLPLSMLKRRPVWSSCGVAFFFFSMMQVVVYYLPIYFQAVKGASPMMSGVYLLPSILSQLIGTLFSGAAGRSSPRFASTFILIRAVTKLGYYLPFAVASSIVASIGHGLLTLLDPDTSTGKWIGYQIIVGFGRGLGMQMPIVAIQNNVSPSLVSISMSLLTFSQTLGGAIMLSIGQTIFTTGLRTNVPKYATGVSAESVIAAGATGLRQAIPDPTTLREVLFAYSKSIQSVYYLAIGCSGACFVFAWGMGWKDIRKKSSSKPKPAPAQEEV